MKLLAKLGIAVLTAAWIFPVNAQDVMGDAAVTGAGSTFAFPVISKWSHGYRNWVAGGGDMPVANAGLESSPPGVQLDYEPVGSLAGTMRVSQSAVDFGASDVPLNSEALAKLNLIQFPIVVGGVVVAVNLDGVEPGKIRFNGAVLADIFLGKIDNWSHPALKQLNPEMKLPDAKIAVVRRSDGSGTTFNFTDYLSRQSGEWKQKVGSDLLVKWPVGTGAKGNDGISRTVKETKNSIGYVEYAHALQTKLSFAAIENKTGTFVVPDPRAFQAAAGSADWGAAPDFALLLNDAPGTSAYPIVATVFALMKKDISPRRARNALNFFDWALTKGADDAASLGYVSLPESLVVRIRNYWNSNLRISM
jgi:phosphate transport system substrate-binding protein